MKQKLRRLALGVLFGMLALCALSLQAGAAEIRAGGSFKNNGCE